MSGRRADAWRVNPRVLQPTSETTHRSAVVAVLYNRVHGQLVTVAEDSETVIWKVTTGQRVFSYFDTEREEDAPLSCADFDEAGRRLITGDHRGRVRVWNFNNGGCLRVLEKAAGGPRAEVTAVASYGYEGARFLAATGWDRRVSVWDDAPDADDELLMVIEAHEADAVSVAFVRPKSLVTTALDGAMSVFDIESGARRLSVRYADDPPEAAVGLRPAARDSGGDGFLDVTQTNYVERIRVLERKGDALVGVGTDGNLTFWDGVGLRPTMVVPARHPRRAALVGLQTDKWNRFLVTADQAGYVKLWDISTFDPDAPEGAQVRALAVWRAHRTAVTGLDLVPYPRPGENLSQFMAGHEASDYVLVTAARDRRALVWACDGTCVGRLGQHVEWSLEDRRTWASPRSEDSAAATPAEDSEEGSEHSGVDCWEADVPGNEGEVDILALLDERLRPKAVVQGLPPVPIEEVPESARKVRKRDYIVDQLTGERIYRSTEDRGRIGDERRRVLTPYLRGFSRKVDPDGVIP